MKGQKYGGRVKGTPNKVSGEAKESIKSMINDYLDEKVFEDLDEVDAATRLNFMAKMSAFVVPKEKDVNLTMSEKRPLGGAMGDLSRMTMEQQIKARPDLFQMLIDKAKAIQEANDAENVS